MRPRFFYLVPVDFWRAPGEPLAAHLYRRYVARRQLPSGGVKIMYQHCEMLRGFGYEAWPVHLGRFTVDWFKHGLEPLSVRAAVRLAEPGDVVVVPEVIPGSINDVPAGRKVVFVQGWGIVERVMGPSGRYADRGFERALCCTSYLAQFMGRREPGLPCEVVINGLDLARFAPAPERRVARRVMMMMRKHPDEAKAAIARLPEEVRRSADWLLVDWACPQEEMIRLYQSADVFVATGYPEGCALPPLEAMACGCAVGGYTGGGGSVFMRDGETALVAPDGDVAALSEALRRLLTEDLLRERLRAAGAREAQRFSMDSMRAELEAFARRMATGGGE